MHDIAAREAQRKQAFKNTLQRRIEKLVPKLIAKAERKSQKGRIVHVTLPIKPYFRIISYYPNGVPYVSFEQQRRSDEELQRWMVTQANAQLRAASSPLEATFMPTYRHFDSALMTRNRLGVMLPE